jgi:hypothetical protein
MGSIRRAAARALLLLVALSAGIPAQAEVLAGYVVMGPAGAASARVIVSDARCPTIVLDGKRRPMHLRARAETLAQRPTQSKPELSKPSAFPVTTCEAAIPQGARRAVVAGRALPLRHGRVDRIVVIGDTGCRLKASDSAYQPCNDPRAYPFATVAARAAAWKPDLVVHVGDYQYRENPCPEATDGCRGSPWGYGWDAWNADFFAPGAPLLAAAPLVLVRGNHENCARAGQGWFRMLDARPLTAGRDCNEAANDLVGDYSAPYAVPLGGREQIVVMDLAIAGNKPLKPGDPRGAQFRSAYEDLKALSARSGMTFMATHKPTLGFTAEDKGGKLTLLPGNAAIQSAFAAADPHLFPSGVDVLLSGHVHLWQQVSFSSDHPTQFIAGFSGTQEDVVPIPETLPADATPAPGAVVDHFSSWVDGFGYMTLERAGRDRWDVKVWNLTGVVVNHCRVAGRRSVCDRP